MQQDTIFSEMMQVQGTDTAGKFFDDVSRLDLRSADASIDAKLDINMAVLRFSRNDEQPLDTSKGAQLQVNIVTSLGSGKEGQYDKSLNKEFFESQGIHYAMCGKVFQMTSDKEDKKKIVIWYAEASGNFNVAIPYVAMDSVGVRKTRIGPALVLASQAEGSEFSMGFRIDPATRLNTVAAEIIQMCRAANVKPEYGVRAVTESGPADLASVTEQMQPDRIVEQVLPGAPEAAHKQDILARYSTTSGEDTKERDPVFSPELGLCIESLAEGYSIEDLWSVE
ncbi:Bardet-Biedl syndrome 5 protein [Kipferlia bialata]|uniref:Bardet-Biedl syndrome 5 protein n=1 Tax=Kipferlia bialata TaxID=797122 RepID=A0A9K3CWS6_9EUKA|nr:Bardet-Biedl syndrome 5 protein [Kipferlia bialata]|eukprot:g4291.t1